MKRLLIVACLAACGGPTRGAGSGTGAGSGVARTSDAGVEVAPEDDGGIAGALHVLEDTPAELNLDEIDPALLGDSGHQVGVELALGKAKAALTAHQWDRAIAQARATLAIDPDEPRAVAILVRAFAGKGWWDSARIALAGLADDESRAAGSGELWHLAGWTSSHLGDSKRALEELAKAVKLRKDDAAAWNLIGVVHLSRGEPTEAVQALENARTHDADSLAILTNLGSAYRRQAVALDPGADRDELLEKAEQSYQSAIRGGYGRPTGGYAPAYMGLGLLYLDVRVFPGLDDVQRLQAAVKNLTESESTAADDVDQAAIDRDLSQARRDLDQARRRADKDREKP